MNQHRNQVRSLQQSPVHVGATDRGRIGLPFRCQSTPFGTPDSGEGHTLPAIETLDDHLETGVGRVARDVAAREGVVEDTEPFLHRPVAGDTNLEAIPIILDQLSHVACLMPAAPLVLGRGPPQLLVPGLNVPRELLH